MKRIKVRGPELLQSNPWKTLADLLQFESCQTAVQFEQAALKSTRPAVIEFSGRPWIQQKMPELTDLLEGIQQKSDQIFVIWLPDDQT